MYPRRRVDVRQHRRKFGPPLRILDVSPHVNNSHDPDLRSASHRSLRRYLEPQKVRVRVHEHNAHPLFPRVTSEGHYKGIRRQASGVRCGRSIHAEGEPPSAPDQPLVDLTATMCRLAGRSSCCPRRTLSFCHVVPRPPDYVVYALFRLCRSAADYEHDLTFHPLREKPTRLLSSPSEDLLVELGKLSAHGDRGTGRKIP